MASSRSLNIDLCPALAADSRAEVYCLEFSVFMRPIGKALEIINVMVFSSIVGSAPPAKQDSCKSFVSNDYSTSKRNPKGSRGVIDGNILS